MLKRLTAAALLLLTVHAANAADIQNIDLGPQAQVWFVEDHTIPVVSFNISLPGGSAHDPRGKAGLAAFTAAMMDEGAGNLNSAAFHQALAAKAIQFSARAERDFTVISVTSLPQDAAEAMRLLQLALTRARFDNEPLARVRASIIQSLQQDAAEPAAVASRAFMNDFFNGHPYGHAATGDVGSIGGITQADLRGFARSHWVKNGVKIAVAGDITRAAVTRLLGQTFAPLPGTAVAPVRDVGRLGRPGVHIVPLPVPQPMAMFGLPGIMRSDPDFIPGYVANYILGGGGFSSRLMDEVRTKRGLSYGVSTSMNSYRKASVWIGQVGTRANAINQTIDVVRKVMADFAKAGPTQSELDDAKTYLTGSFPLAFASNTGIAAQLGTFQRQGLDVGYVTRRNGMIQAVTIEDVRRVARRLFDPARLTVIVAGSPAGGPAPQRPKPAVATPPAPQAAPAKPVDKPDTAKPPQPTR
jgi:zinc protease